MLFFQRFKKKKITQCKFVVQLLSCVQLSMTLRTAAHPAPLSFTVSWSLLQFKSIELVILSKYLTFCHTLSPFAFNLSQHQSLFQWVGSLHQVAKVLGLQLQYQSFQRIFRTDFLQDWFVWSPYCSRDSQESSSTTIWQHQFFGAQLSL